MIRRIATVGRVLSVELDATWWRTARVWWAVFWRWTLANAVGGAVIVTAITSPETDPSVPVKILLGILSLGVGLYFFRWMLNRNFGDIHQLVGIQADLVSRASAHTPY